MSSNSTVSFFPLVTPKQTSSRRNLPPQGEHVFSPHDSHILILNPQHERDSGTGAFLWICETFKNTIFYRTPPVATSINHKNAQNRCLRRFTAVETLKWVILSFVLFFKKVFNALLAFFISNIFWEKI